MINTGDLVLADLTIKPKGRFCCLTFLPYYSKPITLSSTYNVDDKEVFYSLVWILSMKRLTFSNFFDILPYSRWHSLQNV
jgi:hypothetical protein